MNTGAPSIGRSLVVEIITALREDPTLLDALLGLFACTPAPSAEDWVPIRGCGIPYATIRRAIKLEQIEWRKVGREKQVQRRAVQRWINEQPKPHPGTGGAASPEVDDQIAKLLEDGRLRRLRGGR